MLISSVDQHVVAKQECLHIAACKAMEAAGQAQAEMLAAATHSAKEVACAARL
jgi:hypothetical protein